MYYVMKNNTETLQTKFLYPAFSINVAYIQLLELYVYFSLLIRGFVDFYTFVCLLSPITR